ncbi:MAG: class I SAM-dependent rRNA methyltransferase [Rhodospirillaceae bacterium]|nr:class I SAM-dependent rRNA methyltransferase [Rhodospirillaceae bacterium]
MDNNNRPEIRLLPAHGKRLKRGHPWLYSNEIRMDDAARALTPGALVEIIGTDGRGLGVAMFNPHSLIAGRLLSREPGADIDHKFIARALSRALALRESLFDAPYYRLAHGEADGLPGLVVERYDDIALCQINSAGMAALEDEIIAGVEQVLQPRAIVMRGDSPARRLEGLDAKTHVAKGTLDGPQIVREGGLEFFADLTHGQKTGWYFDQRDNRSFSASLAGGRRVLDAYCHSGAFGLRAAKAGATSVTFVDRAEACLDLAAQAAAHNGLADLCHFAKGDMFSELARLHGEGEKFDLVIADPPPFAKSRKDAKVGLKAVRKLTRLASALVAARGFLAISSCSHHIGAADFSEAVTRGFRDAGRAARIVRISGAAADHPIHPALPESAYLTFMMLAFD